MPLVLHPEADDERTAATEWYERKQPGLGPVFLSEVIRAFEVIEDAPETWPEWPGIAHTAPIRRFMMWDFPFALPFVVLEDRVVVLAVAHTRRRPGYWRERAESLKPDSSR
jgi:plasmid stabilization system protein ParE